MTGHERVERYHVRITATAGSSSRAARRFVVGHLIGCGPSTRADAGLIVSELVTNAFEHAAADYVDVEVSVGADLVHLSVTGPDVGGVASPTEWRVAPPWAASGRGLGIVRTLADDVRIETRDGRRRTTVLIRL